ncbi:outer membrane protein [Methylobacterium iners]|uniref:Outer membrane protein beta-barrel domain-containing protein n=2 Tax=Methylobacterium iners TaxID=418707 RepID=A0ABQ4RUK0_9HYPH|nr:hypothetical protein OCOJLMKI_1677 [Methylobacterium iners]
MPPHTKSKTVAVVLLTLVNVPQAISADLFRPGPAEPELRGPLPPEIDVGTGFYLRADVGFSNQGVERLSNSLDALGTIEKVDLGFAGAPFAGLGVGYQFSRWFRADVTGEYRSAATFTGLERYRDASLPLGYGTDEYIATKRDVVVLANAYVDLGSYYGVSPFIGAGVGASHATIENFKDTNVVTQGVSYAKSGSKTSFAWALHAGLGYEVNSALKVELGYRYLNLGDAKTGTVYNYAGQCGACDALTYKNTDSHDVKLGLRWLLSAPVLPIAHPPLTSKY